MICDTMRIVMEAHSDSHPATKGDLRHLEKHNDARIDGLRAHTDARIDGLRTHTDARIDAVEKNQSELRADFRAFISARRAATSAIFAAVVSGAIAAAAAYLLA